MGDNPSIGDRAHDLFFGDEFVDEDTDRRMAMMALETIGDQAERKFYYESLVNMAMIGLPLSDTDITLLQIAEDWEDPSVLPINLSTLPAALEKIEQRNPGSTQLEQISAALNSPRVRTRVQQNMVPFIGGVGKGGASLAMRAGKWMMNHKLATGGIAGGALGLFALGDATDPEGSFLQPEQPGLDQGLIPGSQVGIGTEPMEPLPPLGQTVGDTTSSQTTTTATMDEALRVQDMIVIDPTTGQTVDSGPVQEEEVSTDNINSLSPELAQLLGAMGIDPSLFGQVQPEDPSSINSLYFGDIRVPLDQFPFGVSIRTGVALGQGEATKEDISPRLRAMLPEDDLRDAAIGRAFVPPGGQINPRAFGTYNGTTYMEMIADTAEIFDIPVELLYGQINAMSGFIPNALTPDNRRLGLAQIDLDRYPYVTAAQANNPLFAIRFAGREIRTQGNNYGAFAPAITDAFDPFEAKFLADNGQFNNSVTQSFVSDVYGYAQNSGLGRYNLDPKFLPQPAKTSSGSGRRSSGSRGGGIKVPPFQAPDTDTLAQIVRLTYEDLLGRGPTKSEVKANTSKLTAFFKQKYDADVAKALGRTSTAVDPQASYEEEIRDTGEFAFRTDARGTRDAMSFMGEIAQLMQGV